MANRIRDILPMSLVDTEEPPAMDVVLPDTDVKLRAEGWRLHVYREYADGNVFLASERVLPEKVADPRANRVMDSRRILLHPDEVAWLHARFGELIAAPALVEIRLRAALREALEIAERRGANSSWPADGSRLGVLTEFLEGKREGL